MQQYIENSFNFGNDGENYIETYFRIKNLIEKEDIKNEDPFCSLKSEQNKRIMEVYPFMEKLVDEASDPLYTAVRLAILGNAIDVMMEGGTADIQKIIKKQKNSQVSKML